MLASQTIQRSGAENSGAKASHDCGKGREGKIMQRTQEWFALRWGKVRGSRIKDVTAKIKNGEAATRRAYKAEKVLERYSKKNQERGYMSPAMQDGITYEDAARLAYRFETGSDVQEVDF